MNRLRAIGRLRAGNSGVAPPPATNMVAWYRKGTGITEAAGAVSQWNDQSGNSRHLLQATGAAQPTVQGGLTILFDGTSDFMAVTGGFVLVQPTTIFLRMRQITWTVNDTVFDGNTANTGLLYQMTASPRLTAFAGSNGPTSTGMAVNTWSSVVLVLNGASSVLNIDGVETTGDVGAGNMGGFTLGAAGGGGSNWANIEVAEAGLYSDAKDAAGRAALIAYSNTL